VGRVGLGVARRLLLLGVASAIVLMHHLVGAHEHDAAPAGNPSMAGMSAAVGSAGPSGGSATQASGAQPTDGGSSAAPVPSGAAVSGVHVHPDPTLGERDPVTGSSAPGAVPDVMSMVMHLCLAVLVAGLALATLLLLAVLAGWCGIDPARAARPGAVRSPPYPPPVARRLAALQVLRL
jgi:hypothetical protein